MLFPLLVFAIVAGAVVLSRGDGSTAPSADQIRALTFVDKVRVTTTGGLNVTTNEQVQVAEGLYNFNGVAEGDDTATVEANGVDVAIPFSAIVGIVKGDPSQPTA